MMKLIAILIFLPIWLKNRFLETYNIDFCVIWVVIVGAYWVTLGGLTTHVFV